MSVEQLHPDLGPARVRTDARLPGEPLLNFAGVMELARTGGTGRSRAFYRAGMSVWRQLEGAPVTKGERERRALNAALAEVNRAHGGQAHLIDMEEIQS